MRRVETWTTASHPAAGQAAYWREVICAAFTPLTPVPDARAGDWSDGVSGWVRSRDVDDLTAATVGSVAQRHLHGRREVARTDGETVFVNLMLAGTCVGTQGDRRCVTTPGTFALFDATEPFTLTYPTSWRALSFRVPRSALVEHGADPARTTATATPTRAGAGAVALSLMQTVWSTASGLDATAQAAARTALLAVLAAAAPAAGRPAGLDPADLRRSLHVAVVAHLREHLGERWGAERVAAHFGVSVRTLHHAFEDTGRTFAQTSTALRVEACEAELRSAGTATLTDVATRHGFHDLSHMNRVFRAHRGLLPSQVRARSRG